MFWNSAAATSVNFEVLLSKEDVTLQEIMDDDGVLQECRSHNNHLIAYLVQSDVLEKLVRLTIEEPQGDEDDAVKYKYSNIACELLTCEVPTLSESLANDKALLGKLYSFLDTDAPLNPLLASFFSKTLSVLITRNSERNLYSYQFTCLKVLEFLKLKEDSISLLLKHLGTSAIMDLILKLVTKIDGLDLKNIVLNWLDEQKLVQRLVALLDPSVDPDRHNNAAQLLCDLINILRIQKMEGLKKESRILDRIETPEVVNLLLDHILKEPKCETSILGGISVLLVLLEDKWHDNARIVFDENTQGYVDYLKVVANTTNAILPRLKDFHEILINPPVKPTVRTTVTVLEPPLGAVRVEVAKLFSVLIARDNIEINKKLAELETINVLLDLFFKYTWNNFLHTQVQKCLIYAFGLYPTSDEVEIQKNGLVAHILSKCRLIQRILEAWQENEKQQTEEKRPRRGYMGHLIEIAKKICTLAQIHSFSALMIEMVDNETLNKWENFVNTTLYEIREGYMGGSYRETYGIGKNGSFGDFSQVLYSNYYHVESMGPAYSGDFGSFQDNQNLTSDANDIAERDFTGPENSSSDEDNEDTLDKNKNLDKDDQQLEFYKLSSWPGETDITAQPTDSFNPWASSSLNDVGSDIDWANFESAPFVANFGLNFNSDINTTIATSSSHDIDTIPLDLTPNENSRDIDEIFSKEESEVEMPQVAESNPTPIEYTDLEIITSAMRNVSIETEQQNNTDLEGESEKGNEIEKDDSSGSGSSSGELDSKTHSDVVKKDGDESRVEDQMNCPEISGGVEDVNNVGVGIEQKELDGNFRFPSSQGLTSNSEKESEGGDSYQLLKENVQAVPNEATQISNTEISSNSSGDKSANGPI